MSTLRNETPLNDAILEQASEWFIDCNEGELDAAGRERLCEWLRRSPEHVRAYVEIAAAWEDAALIKNPHQGEIDVLIARALSGPNVIPLPVQRAPQEETATPLPEPHRLRHWWAACAAAALLVAVGVGFHTQRGVHATQVGEQRSIVLEDGSTIELNAHSRLRVRYSESQRLVELTEGQALFEVKKDSARPFVVTSNGSVVRAVGTRFDVYRRSENTTTVTVLEGRVAVAPASGATLPPSSPRNIEAEVLIGAGEQLTLAPSKVPEPVPVDVSAATAWTQRRLVFDGTPLVEAIAEFNRYNARRIVIDDAALGGFHIRGNFDATEPGRLLEFLRARLGVRVIEQGDEIHIASDTQ